MTNKGFIDLLLITDDWLANYRYMNNWWHMIDWLMTYDLSTIWGTIINQRKFIDWLIECMLTVEWLLADNDWSQMIVDWLQMID